MLIAAEVAYRAHHGGGAEPGLPPLVFIHGAGGSSLHWPPPLRRLSGLEVYALDLPGHGESPGPSDETIAGKVDAVLRWKEALGLGPCVFAGHSMGGGISLTLTLDHPGEVAGLVLVGTGGRLRVHPDILAMTASEETYPQAVATIGAWAFSEAADERLVQLAGKRMLAVPHQVVNADFTACDRFDVMPRLGEIQRPTLVICGSEDQLTPQKYSRFLADTIPQALMVVIDGAGHMVMLEQPEEVAGHIQEFLRSLV
jgi:pimeloyl-ACP methyl ester carboxylesterase